MRARFLLSQVVRRCEVCGSEESQFELYCRVQKPLRSGALDQFTVYRCRSCRFVFRHPLESEDAIYSFYNQEYFDGQGMDPGFDKHLKLEDHLVEKNRHLILDIVRKANRSLPLTGNGQTFLDIGCCTGESLVAAQALGYEAHGVELSEEICQFNRANAQLNIFNGTLKEAAYLDNTFDLIICIETLEHIPDPNVFFSELKRILKPGGVAYVETGNVECWKAKHPPKSHGQQWFYYNRLHIYYYSPRTATRMLKKVGLKKLFHEPFVPFSETFRTRAFGKVNRMFGLGYLLSPILYLGMMAKDFLKAQGFAIYVTK